MAPTPRLDRGDVQLAPAGERLPPSAPAQADGAHCAVPEECWSCLQGELTQR